MAILVMLSAAAPGSPSTVNAADALGPRLSLVAAARRLGRPGLLRCQTCFHALAVAHARREPAAQGPLGGVSFHLMGCRSKN